MQLIRQARELKSKGRKVCLAIGMFDGVHLGHQQVIRQTILDARQHEANSVAITFDRHPNSVVAPEKKPPLIYSLNQKLRELDNLGIDTTLLLEFTPEFSKIPAEQFIRSLHSDFGAINSICVGRNFTFGYKRGGTVESLKRMSSEFGFTVHGMAPLSLDGRVISSTRIREAIHEGSLDAATQMLGRTYSLAGTVLRGDQLGTKLGFPTANIDVSGLITPPAGVYAVRARHKGALLPAVVNIGFRPTLERKTPELRVETHILGFKENIYDEELEILFLGKLRPERKFADLSELKVQIARDIVAAQKYFASDQPI